MNLLLRIISNYVKLSYVSMFYGFVLGGRGDFGVTVVPIIGD